MPYQYQLTKPKVQKLNIKAAAENPPTTNAEALLDAPKIHKTEQPVGNTSSSPNLLNSTSLTGGRKRKTRRKGKKSKKKRTKRTKAGKTKKTRTSLNSPIISRHARSLRHRSPIFIGSSLIFRRKRK